MQDSYVGQMVFRLDGTLDAARLRAAAETVVQRHASLRAAFVHENVKEPVQVIQRSVTLPWQELTLPGDPAAAAQALAQAIADDQEQRFDLAKAPLLRFTLVRESSHRHYLLFTSHHILLDGWSTPILLQELFALYRTGNDERALAPVTPYRDYFRWLAARDRPAARAAWSRAFEGVGELARMAPSTTAAVLPEVFRLPLADELTQALAAQARRLGVTLNSCVQAAWAIVLSQLVARDDVVFGTPVSGRPPELAGIEEMVGLFINTIPVRVQLDSRETIAELLLRVQREQAVLLEHQHLGLAEIQRLSGSNELFDTLVVFENFPVAQEQIGGDREQEDALQVSLHSHRGGDTSHYPISVALLPGAHYQLKISFRPDQIDEHRARQIGDSYLRVLAAFAGDSQCTVGRIELLSATERTRLVQDWNGHADPIGLQTLPQLLEQQVARTPDATALQFESSALDYCTFNRRANQLAHTLIVRGVGPGDIVAISLPRSLELLVAIHAVSKSGAAWMPLDPDYPSQRLQQMLDDAMPACVITRCDSSAVLRALAVDVLELDAAQLLAQLEDAAAHDPSDRDRRRPLLPQDAAYLIYTSGSTGTPKGVVTTQAGICNRLQWMQREYRLQADDAVLHKTPSSFDVSVWECFWPLMAGARLVIARPDGHRDPVYLAGLMAQTAVTTVHFVASMLDMFVQEPASANLPGLRRIICGGEALSVELAQRVREQIDCELHQSYGPTEAAIAVTAWQCRPDHVDGPLPIGPAISNTRLYVLDRALRPLPPGSTGELYIAGLPLARGYLNRAGLTAERFVADPFVQGERMYRTGDLASWRPDGVLVHRGRVDHQVKVRGFRIELGEIESALAGLGHPGSVVLAREDQPGVRRLVAYVVAENIDAAALRNQLGERLPEYMVPAAIVALPQLPLTANGKLDRNALPAPDFSAAPSRPPRDAREQLLCELFADVLGLDRIGVDDDFFARGGHSLLAIRLTGRIRTTMGCEVSIRALFEAPTVALLAQRMVAGEVRPPLLAKARPSTLPLSFAQQRLWFLHQLEGPSPTYNIPLALRMRGALDTAALQSALDDVVARHESLRTVFPAGDTPCQEVLAAAPLCLELHETCEEDLEAALAAHAAHCFDISTQRPLRAHLLRLDADHHVLLLVLHHIAGDGESLAPLARDLGQAYAARCEGRSPDWAPLPVQYADYTLWQRELLGDVDQPDSRMRSQQDFWKDTLGGLPETIDLPCDRLRPVMASHRGAQQSIEFDAVLHAQLLALARSQRVTLYMLLQAALAATLTRLGAGSDIALGCPTAGRSDAALQDLIGFFVNTLVLRTDTSGNPTFAGLLERVRAADLAAWEHQDIPFEQLVDALNPSRSLAWHPLFQVMLAVQNSRAGDLRLPGLELSSVPIGLPVAKFDLAFDLAEQVDEDGQPAGLRGSLEYATDLFDAGTCAMIVGCLQRVLRAMVADPKRRIGEVSLLDAADASHAPGDPFVPEDRLFTDAFARQVAARPDAPALVFDTGTLSYRDLDERANRLAHLLRANGVDAGHRVAVALPRSPELLIALVAVMKARAVWMPVDPDYPVARLRWMLTDARPRLLLARDRELATISGGVPLLVLGEANTAQQLAQASTLAIEGCGSDLRDPAYLIYTSGSTGQPKGVLVSHAGVTTLACAQIERFEVSADSRVLQFASPSFDAAISEACMALLAGASLVLVDRERLVPGEPLVNTMTRHRITHATLPPAALPAMSPRQLPDCTHLVVAGEACAPHLVEAWSQQRSMFNAYGPTEATVCASMSQALLSAADLSIGRPLPNTRLYVLDPMLQTVPAGVPGELYIAGPSLALGYLDRAALTAERFVADPFVPGERMYRSGDRVRRRQDGRLDFLGRGDRQLKLRGMRIEPGEIEAALANLGYPANAVLLREDRPGQQRLVAYVVAPQVDAQELRGHLSQQLPEHMVPATVIALAALPLTANGKLDARALPAPAFSTDARQRPQGERELALARLFAEVIGLDESEFGVDDGFFALGGDSISSIQLVGRARKAGLQITARDVFQHQSVQALARVAGAIDEGATQPPRDQSNALVSLTAQELHSVAARQPALQEVLPLTPLQHGFLFHAMYDEEAPDSYLVQLTFEIDGPLDARELRRAGQALLERHANLRAAFLHEGLHEPVQAIVATVQLPWREVVLEGSPAEREAALAQILREDQQQRFDLATAPLLRFCLVQLGPQRHQLIYTCHHILLDGWSSPVLLRELFELYAQRNDLGAMPAVTPYRDYLSWLADRDREAAREAWAEALEGLDAPTRLASQPIGTVAPQLRAFSLPQALTARMGQRARALGVTLNTVVQAAWGLVLAARTGRDDVAFGITVSGRPPELAGVERMVGLFINTVPLRLRVRPGERLDHLLQRLQREQTELLDHQHLGLAEIQQITGTGELFDSVTVFENYPVELDENADDSADALRIHSWRSHGGDSTHYPLGLSVIPGEQLALKFSWRPDLFEAAEIEEIAAAFERVLAHLAGDETPPVAMLDPFADAQARRAEMLAMQPEAVALEAHCWLDWFDRHVIAQPEAPALWHDGETISYAALDQAGLRLAQLLTSRGIGVGDLVAMLLPRSPLAIQAMLAISRCGAAFVPLDPQQPRERLHAVLADADVRCVLVMQGERPLIEGSSVPAVVLDDAEVLAEMSQAAVTPASRPRHPDAPAYLIYTSGSTGKPKGVLVGHAALASSLQARMRYYPSHQRQLLLPSLAFDAALAAVLGTLCRGACLVLPVDGDEKHPARLATLVALAEVDAWLSAPALYAATLAEAPASLVGLATVVLGGESMPAGLPVLHKQGLTGCALYNEYGPTETTIWCSAARLDNVSTPATNCIGVPVSNARAYVLDNALRPVANGCVGELYVGGGALALGYLGRRGQSAERFVADPFVPGARMYRSGDLVRRLGDGQLEFLGRSDEQVKIRGHRIETGEIEAALAMLGHPRCAVVAREDQPGRRQLVAYLVADHVDAVELRQQLGRSLPDYMVPAAVVCLDALPLTANGKLDRRALPAPLATAARPPRDLREELLCGLFAQVLGLDNVGIDEGFFALGGDSIGSIQLVSRARKAGLQFSARDVFERQTVEALASVAQTLAVTPSAPAVAPTGELPATPIIDWLLEQPGGFNRFSQSMLLQLPASDEATMLAALQAVIDHHHALRLRLLIDKRMEIAAVGSVQASDCLKRVGLDGLDEKARAAAMQAHAIEAVDRLDPRAGRMLQAVWFDDPQRPRLLLVLHHLVVDGVSWRILLPDLASAWAACAAGEAAQLEPVPTSFRQWALALPGVAEQRTRELPFWQSMLAGAEPRLGARALDAQRDLGSTREGLGVSLEPATTRALLTRVPECINGRINDVLLTAFALAVADWRSRHGWGDHSAVRFDLEGHGREAIVDGADLSRTVGWFTSMFPVQLDLGDASARLSDIDDAALLRILKVVKEQLRRLPDQGIGYGLLNHLHAPSREALAGAENPQIGFNYLGRFGVAEATNDREPWALAAEGGMLEGGSDASRPLIHSLSLNALTQDSADGPRLHANWSWAGLLLEPSQVQDLADTWFAALRRLACVGGSIAGRQMTPSDLPLVELEQSQIEAIEATQPPLQDILPLAPLQHGFLFHSLYDPSGSDSYIVQLAFQLDGALDAAALQRAAQALLERHPNLRAGFLHEGLEEPVQVIPRQVQVPWQAIALEGSPDEREAELSSIIERDRLRRFNPEQAPLLRFTLVRRSEREHLLLFTCHHILLDGWSSSLLLGDLFALYQPSAAVQTLPRAVPYRDYLAWLHRRGVPQALHAWREALAGVTQATRLVAASGASAVPCMHAIDLSASLSSALEDCARRHGLTTNTLASAAWALLLARLTGRDDVVFGVTVSGRPPEVVGIEQMVGMFINTVPLRLQLRPQERIAALLTRLQREQTALMDCQHVSLADIQRAVGIGELFDTLMVFENFPSATRTHGDPKQPLTVSMLSSHGAGSTHYPLGVCIIPGQRFKLDFSYRPDLLDQAAVARIGERFVALLQMIATEPQRYVGTLDVLVEDERAHLMQLNATSCAVPAKTVVERDPS
nr:NRPS [uncultured bacterium]